MQKTRNKTVGDEKERERRENSQLCTSLLYWSVFRWKRRPIIYSLLIRMTRSFSDLGFVTQKTAHISTTYNITTTWLDLTSSKICIFRGATRKKTVLLPSFYNRRRCILFSFFDHLVQKPHNLSPLRGSSRAAKSIEFLSGINDQFFTHFLP